MPVYYGTQKVKPSGISTVYCGTQKVYSKKASRLPAEYQEVEYIYKLYDGGATHPYINSGVNGQYALITEYEAMIKDYVIPDTGSGGGAAIFGSRVGFTDRAYQATPRYADASNASPNAPGMYYDARFGNQGYNYGSRLTAFQVDVKHKVKFGNDELYVNDVLKQSFGASSFTSTVKVYIFAANANGAVGFDDTNAEGRLYWMTMSQGSTLLRNFVPCYRKSDSKAGLYDLVNNQFYYNQGTGSLYAGPDV